MASTLKLQAGIALASLLAGSDGIKASENWRSFRSCGNVSISFDDFIVRFDKSYVKGSPEYERRRGLFHESLAIIESHNCDADMPWRAGVNQLADWTQVELAALRGYKPGLSAARSGGWGVASGSVLDQAGGGYMQQPIPESVDWGYLDSMQESRDQGQCGSCWAFAAETVMRAHAEIKKRPHEFSVAQIIACTPNPHKCGGSGGCDGATAELAYEYVLQAGAMTAGELREGPGGSQVQCPSPRKARVDQVTQVVVTANGNEMHMLGDGDANMRGREIGMVGWTKLASNKEEPLLRALVENGPAAIAVAAGPGWNYYYQGVMTRAGCDQNFVISHAVTLFGFGVSHSSKTGGAVRYWHIKNSWGQYWGEKGNLRLQRLDNEDELCGWDRKPEVGNGCEGGPNKIWVCGSCGILLDSVVPHFNE